MFKKRISLIIIGLMVSGLLVIGGTYFVNRRMLLKKEVESNSSAVSTSTVVSVTEDKSGLIGINIEKKDTRLIISRLLEGKPAQQAGLKVGDEIIKVDGKSVENISIEEATKLIRGKPGTEIILLIRRDNQEENLEFKIERTAFRKLPSKICQDPVKLSKIPEAELAELNDLPEFYSGVSWNEIPQDRQSGFGRYAAWIQLENINFPELCGKEWVARIDAYNIDEINSFGNSFHKYYDSEFLKRGWDWKINVRGFEIIGAAADGSGGSMWGYLKATKSGLRAIILSTDSSGQSVEMMKDLPLGLICPCEVEFRIFYSDIIPIEEIIP